MPNDDGFAALRDKLHALADPKQIAKIQRKALKEVGALFQAAIVERAPEKAEGAGGELGPGELKASIKARVSVPSDEAITDGKPAKVTIGPTGRLAKLIGWDVENGHENARSSARGNRDPGAAQTPPHPFVRPAFDATKDKAVAAYKASVTTDLQKAMK